MFFVFFPLRCALKANNQISLTVTVWLWILWMTSGQPSAFTIFELTLWFYHEFMSIPKAFFPIGFALYKLYSTFLIPVTNIYTLQNVSSPTSMILSSWKRIYYVYLNVILLAFLSKSEVQATNNCVLRDSRAKLIF